MKKTFKVTLLPSENFKEDLKLQSGEVLPVVKVGTIILDKETNKLSLNKNSHWSATCDIDVLEPQQICFVSEDQVNNGEWFLDSLTNKLEKLKNSLVTMKCFSKVIASTDKEITPNSFIGQEFVSAYIKAYNEGEPIAEVDLEIDERISKGCGEFACTCGGCEVIIKIKTRPDKSVIIHKSKLITNEEMFLNMQYYAEYCQINGYVTPQNWLENHKHF